MRSPALVLILVIAMSVGGAVGSDVSPLRPAYASRTVQRCGVFRDADVGYPPPPQDRWGVYVLRGTVRCKTAIAIARGYFAGRGKPVNHPGFGNVLYRGFLCRGQMGSFLCETSIVHVAKAFGIQACSAPRIGCPATESDINLP